MSVVSAWGGAARPRGQASPALRLAALVALVALLALLWPLAPARAEDSAAWMRQAARIFRPVAQDADLPFMVIPEALAQDSQGFLWLGGESGLARWDGYALRVYAPDRSRPDTMRNQFIQCLHRDAQGRLWAGTVTDGLARLDAAQGRFQLVLRDRLAGDGRHIWAMDDDGAGGLWLGTGAGLFHLDAGATALAHAATAASGAAADAVLAVLRDRDGVLWAGTQHGLLRGTAANSRFTPVPLPIAAGAPPAVSRLMQDAAGRIWAGTRQHGAFLLDAGGGAARLIGATVPAGQTAAATEITALAEVAPDRVWIGTYGNGIVEVAAGDAEHATRIRHDAETPFSLPADSVQSLYRDASGLVWAGTGQGLSQAAPAQQAVRTLFGDPARGDGLTGQNVMSLLARPDGSLWAGAQGTGYDVLRNTGAVTGQLPGRRVFALAEAPAGGVLVGTDGGLYWADPQGQPKARLAVPHYAGVEDVRALSVQGGTIWLGSRESGLWQLRMAPDGALSLIRHWAPGLIGGSRVMAVGQAADGRVAVGLEDGFSLIDPATGAVERLRNDPADPSSLGPGMVDNFLTDRQGRLWVGTSDSGISLMQGHDAAGRPAFRHIGVPEGLPNADINCMLPDRAGRVWASTDNGIAVVDPADGSVRALRRADGVAIKGYWAGAGAAMNDGTLVFGGQGGVTLIRPDLFRPWRYLPPLAITSIRLGGRPVARPADDPAGAEAPPPGLVVPPRMNSLAVEFTALDLSAPERNRYGYRLEGFDQDWIEGDASHRVASYTSLPPGSYTLHLRGSNRDGVWSRHDLILPIRVQPAWFQTLWFRIATACAAVALVWALVRSRTIYHLRREQELELLVTQRTAELEESKRQIEQIAYHDALTGLPNRRLFTEELRNLTALAMRQGLDFALLMIDLDQFKRINDTLGHDAGDALLVEASRRMRAALRVSDRLIRLGGDEFAVLITDVAGPEPTLKHIVDVACSRIVDCFSHPIPFQGVQMTTSPSIGISACLACGATPEAIYKAADLALYEAKRAGRNTWRWHPTAAGSSDLADAMPA